MSRLNGRIHQSGQVNKPVQYAPVPTQHSGQAMRQYPPDNSSTINRETYDPSCLVRTNSGSVYIPSGDLTQTSMDFKQGVHHTDIHSPLKDNQKTIDAYNARFGTNIAPPPVLPIRNNLRLPGDSMSPAYDSGGRGRFFQRGSQFLRCSWRCTAVVFITIAVVLAVLLGFVAVTGLMNSIAIEEDCETLNSIGVDSAVEDSLSKSSSRGNPFSSDSKLYKELVISEDTGDARVIVSPSKRMRRSVSHDLDPSMSPSANNSIINAPLISPARTPNPFIQSSSLFFTALSLDNRTKVPNSAANKTNGKDDRVPNKGGNLSLKSPFKFINVTQTNTTNKPIDNNVLNEDTNGPVLSPSIDVVEYDDNYDIQIKYPNDDGNETTNLRDGSIIFQEYSDYDDINQTDSVFYPDSVSDPSRNKLDLLSSEEKGYGDIKLSGFSNSSVMKNKVEDDAIKNETRSSKRNLIYLLNLGPKNISNLKYPFTDGWSTNNTSLRDQMVGDDPSALLTKKESDHDRKMWNLGWIFSESKSLSKLGHINGKGRLNSEGTSPNRQNSKEFIQKSPGAATNNHHNGRLPQKLYKPFSTWPVSKKGGISVKPFNSEMSDYTYSKGGRISNSAKSEPKDFIKRSTRNMRLPFQSFDESITSAEAINPTNSRSDNRGYKRTYDPLDPNGGPIPMSDPSKLPSKILESAGAPRVGRNYRGNSYHSKLEQDKQHVTAIDVFPHLFEYDLNDHDDYYYDDDKSWFDIFWTTDDMEINEDRSNMTLTNITAVDAVNKSSSGNATNKVVSVPLKLPTGLKVMSLTKEHFQVEAPNSPIIMPINAANSEVEEKNKMFHQIVEKFHGQNVPIINNKNNFSEEKIEIIPLKEDGEKIQKKISNKAANEVYIHSMKEKVIPINKTEQLFFERPSTYTTPTEQVLTPSSTYSTDVRSSINKIDEVISATNSYTDATNSNKSGIVYKGKTEPERLSAYKEPNSRTPITIQAFPDINTNFSIKNRTDDLSKEFLITKKEIRENATIPPHHSFSIHPRNSTEVDESERISQNSNAVKNISSRVPNRDDDNDSQPFVPLDHNLNILNSSPNAQRVMLNVTISTEGGTNAATKDMVRTPIYILSLSIPTSANLNTTHITLMQKGPNGNAQNHDSISKYPKLREDAANIADSKTQNGSVLSSNNGNSHASSDTCQCKCPSPQNPQPVMNDSSLNESSSNNSSGCKLWQQLNSTLSGPEDVTSHLPTTTQAPTTPPTLSPNLIGELEDHRQRPHKTIPPDGTTFKMIEIGQTLKQSIDPFGYWNMQFYQPQSAYVQFEISIPRGASIGVYGRRNALPTHTSYDFLKVLSGYKINKRRNIRSTTAPTQTDTIVKYLEQGHWFLSVYNDDGDPQQLSLSAIVSSEFTKGCPKGCSGNGDCALGACQCHPGFTGRDCTEMKCPILCSSHGEYNEGQCICRPGWKGQECSVRHDECEVPDCSRHGHCVDGVCRCAKGYKGQFCQEVDCPHPTCFDHGWCVNGSCICSKGWRGPDCSQMDDAALQCLPDCSGHGHFDLIGQQCSCEPEWTGSECNIRVCGLNCGIHGRCESGRCVCSDGWTGDRCELRTCDERCEEHGQCKNGTCICMTGWNGRHCTIVGCPNSCSGHGSCVMVDLEWSCTCGKSWEGIDCSAQLENICDDGIDNDHDGLTDCADAECCPSESCAHSTLCKTSIDPIDILLRKQPPAVTASFFQRMRFIVEESSVQVYAEMSSFNQSRAAVVRGRIVSGRGSGLVGVRVSHFLPGSTGFTLSRHGGWFDLMVNGGGAVKLLFGKTQFVPVTKTAWVPWNEIVVVDTVKMTTSEVIPPPPPAVCPDHDYVTLKPVVLASWKHGFQGGCPHCSAILAESQVVQESLAIPGTGLHLVYHSSRALGYESTIQLQLTPHKIPSTLRRIYLKISIEGILFEKIFEADADIKYTYAWNRLNIYRQKVYGISWATVRVGYSYSNCDQTIVDTQSTQVSGHDVSVSDIGGWDLSIHHRYNFHEGILQKGDGKNLYLKQRPQILSVLMGDGRQREVSCSNCNGEAQSQRLLTPAALAASPDGSLYVADFNLIRRIYPNRLVKTIVKLKETRVSYRYHLAVSPVDSSVYISDPEGHQILKVKNADDFSDPSNNYMAYVGSGERCLPGDEIGCGDGGLARDAKLQYPKGMVVSSKEVLFFADGTNVRSVDKDEIISTVIGTHMHRAHWQPLPCSGTLSVADVSLRWPTTLAVSPLDESLYILDDHHVLKLTSDGQVKVIAGRPLHCPLDKSSPSDLAAHTTIKSPQSISFDPNGNLYISESDGERINRIRIITSDERIHNFAGSDSKCNCREDSCRCFDESHVLAATAVFSTISSITVTSDGTIHILDQGNLRIRAIMASIPQPTIDRNYEIYSPETQELYIFNRFGHHIETRNIPTRRSLYAFIYNVNTSNGKLSSVTDVSGNKINFLRDYAGHVTMIENSRQQKCHLKMSRMRKLEQIVTSDDHNISLTYHGASGLLRSRMDTTGRAHVYTYDTYGRLTRTVTPSGEVIDLSFDLSEEGARVTVTRNGESSLTMLIKDSFVTKFIGSASSLIAKMPDGSVIMRNAWGHYTATETVPYKLIESNVLANSFPVPGRQRTEIGDGLINSFDWKYYYDRSDEQSAISQVGRKMRVNGEELLDFKYDIYSGTEAVVNKDKLTLLNITYDDLGRPLRWSPATPFKDVTLTYDRFGLIKDWSWGNKKEHYLYDRSGRFQGIQYEDSSKITYSYKDSVSIKPYKVTVDGGTEHLLEYDQGGGLSAVITPRGHKYKFQLQPSVLHNRFTFTYPGSSNHPYQILYSDDGHLLAKVLPQQTGRIVYSYDKGGRLQYQIFGDGSIEYGYHPETGLTRSVTLRELAYEQRVDNKYHAGLIKEQRIRFGPAVPMNAAKLKFLYDGNARPRRIEIEINGKQLPNYEIQYDMILGTLIGIDDLTITKSHSNRTIIQDSSKSILKIRDYNLSGRILQDSFTVRGKLTHRIEYSYDYKGRVTRSTLWYQSGPLSVVTNYTYSPDGYLKSAEGIDSWQFKYDINGNLIAVVMQGREITAVYDIADRLIGWGDQEINVYDAAGRVIRQRNTHFSYTARGNIRHAWKEKHFRITYRHDHKGRLTSWEDHKGNATQFLYANLLHPNLPSHVHYPASGVTHSLFYDNRGHLIAINTDKGKLWVITDNVGSPVAVYDNMGAMVKEIVRSPWGNIIKETNPQLRLQIDFFGGIKDPGTGLLFFGLYAYDPAHGQWMTPRFDKIQNVPEHIPSIYIHRFENNNPVNKLSESIDHYTDIHSWLRGFGIDMEKILGSKYHDETIDNPLSKMEIKNIDMSIKVISGLSCSTESVLKQFSRPSFLQDSLVQMGEPRLVGSKCSMLGKFSSSGPVLGAGILVSRVNGMAVVTLVPSSENSVVQSVARDVLNGSALLDITLPHHRHHTLYLVKEDSSSKEDDLQQLQRLSGIFNITKHEGELSEIRVTGAKTSLVFIYGIAVDKARHRILRHVHHRSAEHAWKTEQRLLQTGGPSLHPWSAEEKNILLKEGKVPGFTAAELHSVHKFPLLADDASNVVFRRDVDRRRRRSKAMPTS